MKNYKYILAAVFLIMPKALLAESPAGWCGAWGCPPTAAVQATRVVRQGAALPNWTWPGDLRRHLEATHGVSTAGASHADLVTMHNRLHNAAVGRLETTATNTVASPQIMWQPATSSCPGGVCPVPTRTTVPARRGLFGRLR